MNPRKSPNSGLFSAPGIPVVPVVTIGAEDVVDQPAGEQALDAKGKVDLVRLAGFDFALQLGKKFEKTLMLARVQFYEMRKPRSVWRFAAHSTLS